MEEIEETAGTEEGDSASEIPETELPTTETQPSIEELKSQLETEKAERTRFENLHKESQRNVSSIIEEKKRLGEASLAVASLPERVSGLEDLLLMSIQDNEDATNRASGMEVEERPQLSRVGQYLQNKKEAKGKEKEVIAPASVSDEELDAGSDCREIIRRNKWDDSSPVVQEAMKHQTAIEALTVLRKADNDARDTQNKKEAELMFQKKLKETGVSTAEISKPSGSGGIPSMEELDKMSPDEYARQREKLNK